MTDYKTQIQDLLEHLCVQLPQLDAETHGIQMFGAPGMNVFSMFEPDERRVTNILADLLNPKGRHGQGNLFLNAFLSATDLPEAKRQDHVAVVVDDATSNGRLVDITVSTPGALLGIEVKLWARQQTNQLQDYFDHLKKKAQGRPTELIFLADQDPETAEDEVIRMPWAKTTDHLTVGKHTAPLKEI